MSSREHPEDFSWAHIVSLIIKLINSAKESDALSIGIDGDCKGRQQELTKYQHINGK